MLPYECHSALARGEVQNVVASPAYGEEEEVPHSTSTQIKDIEDQIGELVARKVELKSALSERIPLTPSARHAFEAELDGIRAGLGILTNSLLVVTSSEEKKKCIDNNKLELEQIETTMSTLADSKTELKYLLSPSNLNPLRGLDKRSAERELAEIRAELNSLSRTHQKLLVRAKELRPHVKKSWKVPPRKARRSRLKATGTSQRPQTHPQQPVQQPVVEPEPEPEPAQRPSAQVHPLVDVDILSFGSEPDPDRSFDYVPMPTPEQRGLPTTIPSATRSLLNLCAGAGAATCSSWAALAPESSSSWSLKALHMTALMTCAVLMLLVIFGSARAASSRRLSGASRFAAWGSLVLTVLSSLLLVAAPARLVLMDLDLLPTRPDSLLPLLPSWLSTDLFFARVLPAAALIILVLAQLWDQCPTRRAANKHAAREQYMYHYETQL